MYLTKSVTVARLVLTEERQLVLVRGISLETKSFVYVFNTRGCQKLTRVLHVTQVLT